MFDANLWSAHGASNLMRKQISDTKAPLQCQSVFENASETLEFALQSDDSWGFYTTFKYRFEFLLSIKEKLSWRKANMLKVFAFSSASLHYLRFSSVIEKAFSSGES